MDVNEEKRLLVQIIGKQTVDIAIFQHRIAVLENQLASTEQALQTVLAAKAAGEAQETSMSEGR